MSPAEIDEALQAGRRLADSSYAGDWGNGLLILEGVPGEEASALRRQLRTQYETERALRLLRPAGRI